MSRRGRKSNKGFSSLVRSRKSKLFWKKIISFQNDVRDGMSYSELMIKYGIGSRTTVANWKKLVIPEKIFDKTDKTERDKKTKARVEEIQNSEDANIDLMEFVEGEKYLNIKLFPMQRVILKAFYDLPLTPEEKKILLKLKKEGKTNWVEGRKYRELVLDCGMKSGKTTLAAVITSIAEKQLWDKGNPSAYYGFPPGEEIFIINVATTRDQAKDTIFAKTKGLIENSEFYRKRKPNILDKEIEFENDVKIRSGHSNSASIVGKGGPLVLFDELARFTNTKGVSSGERVYSSLTRNISNYPDGKIVSLSSPLTVDDKITTLYKQCFKIDNMLGFHLATWEMNPKLPFDNKETIQTELKKSPEDFWRDYGAQPSQSLEAYYRDPQKIPVMFENGKKKKMINPIKDDGSFKDFFKGNIEFDYYLHLDPAVNNCGFGLGLAHRIGDRVIADLAYRFRVNEGEIDYERVKEFLLLVLGRFPTIKIVSYDSYLAVSLYQELKKYGLEAVFLNINKEVQDVLKEQVRAGNVETYPNRILENELKGLELISGRKVDHKKGGTKDISDGVAGAVWHCMKEETILPASAGLDSDSEVETEEEGRESGRRRSLIWD